MGFSTRGVGREAEGVEGWRKGSLSGFLAFGKWMDMAVPQAHRRMLELRIPNEVVNREIPAPVRDKSPSWPMGETGCQRS